MGISFTYECPECREAFVGEVEDGKMELHKNVHCDECGYMIDLDVEIEVVVQTS